MLHRRHHGDCAEFFRSPQLTEPVQLDAPRSTIHELEHAAARANREWNAQFNYILGVLLGKHPPDFEDPRSTEDWRTLMMPCRLRWGGVEEWYPASCLWRQIP